MEINRSACYSLPFMVDTSNDNRDNVPERIKRLLWIFKKKNWRERPFLTALLTFLEFFALVAIVLVPYKAWEDYCHSSVTKPPAILSWHEVVGSCQDQDVEAFLKQICDELPGGATDPLDRNENRALMLRSSLKALRENGPKRYEDYFVFYSSPIGGNLVTLEISVNKSVEAVVGVRLFEKIDSQIVPTNPVLKISKRLSFSRSLNHVERALVYIFPLTAQAAQVLKQKEFTENIISVLQRRPL